MECEKSSCATQAALDLVRDQQRAALAAEFLGRLQEFFADGHDAALALHGFDQDRRNARREALAEVGHVVQTHKLYARHERLERFAVLFGPSGRQRAERASVKRVFERQDLDAIEVSGMLLAGIGARQFHRAVGDLGARVGKEDALEPGQRSKLLGERGLIGMVEEIGDVEQRLRLVAQDGENLRMAVAERVHRQPTQKIQVFPAALVVEIASLSPDRQDGQAVIGRNQHALLEFCDFFEFHLFQITVDSSIAKNKSQRHKGQPLPGVPSNDSLLAHQFSFNHSGVVQIRNRVVDHSLDHAGSLPLLLQRKDESRGDPFTLSESDDNSPAVGGRPNFTGHVFPARAEGFTDFLRNKTPVFGLSA